MVRFRLRTPFLTFARDQIRNGVWYKPSWWDAVRYVPPLGTLPRIKKKQVPKLHFIEDRLIREFQTKNPMIARHDYLDFYSPDASSVSSQFAAKQVEEMTKGYSEKEAYTRAEEWMIANGNKILQRLKVPEEFKDSLDAEKMFKDAPDTLAFRALEKQWKLLKEGLAQDLIERPPVEQSLPALSTTGAPPKRR